MLYYILKLGTQISFYQFRLTRMQFNVEVCSTGRNI